MEEGESGSPVDSERSDFGLILMFVCSFLYIVYLKKNKKNLTVKYMLV